MKKITFTIVLLFFALSIFTGCGKKMPPDCNDDKTKEIVLTIVKDNWADFFIFRGVIYRNFKYKDGKLKGEVILEKPWKDDPKNADVEFYLSYVRPEKVDKEIGKYVCLAKVNCISVDHYGSYDEEVIKTLDIAYTSEFADNKNHVSFARKTGEGLWETISKQKKQAKVESQSEPNVSTAAPKQVPQNQSSTSDATIEKYNTAIRQNPNDAKAYYDRGVAYGNLGMHQKAILDFNEAIRLKQDYASAYNKRGVVYLDMGDKVQGCNDAQKACGMGECMLYELAKKERWCR